VPQGWAHSDTGELLVAFGDTSYVIPAASATISSIKLGRNKLKYKTGDVIKFLVQFNEPVIVTGTPEFPFHINSAAKNALFVIDPTKDATNVAELMFEYTVQSGDSATAGQFTVGTALALNGGTIKNSGAGNANATLTFGANAPVVTSVTVN
jgi:hypothetical protein